MYYLACKVWTPNIRHMYMTRTIMKRTTDDYLHLKIWELGWSEANETHYYSSDIFWISVKSARENYAIHQNNVSCSLIIIAEFSATSLHHSCVKE